MKKTIRFAFMLCIITILSFNTGFADDIAFNINNANDECIVKENKCYIKLRPVVDKLGCNLIWNNENQGAIIKKDNNTLCYEIGSDNVIINDLHIKLSTPILLMDNHTYVPSDFFTSTFGGHSSCNHQNSSIIINLDFKSLNNKYENIPAINKIMNEIETKKNIRCIPVALNSPIIEIIPENIAKEYFLFEVVSITNSDITDCSPDYLICVNKLNNEVRYLYPDLTFEKSFDLVLN